MTSILTGVFASQISGHLFTLTGSYDALATVTVPSGGASSIVFSAIPQTGYKHLEIRGIARTDRASTADGLKITWNGNTDSNYAYHQLYGDGSSAAAVAGTGLADFEPFAISGASSTSGVMGAFIFNIPDYAVTTKRKTWKGIVGLDQNGSGQINLFSSAYYNDIAPITSIKMTPYYGSNFSQYSQFSLYGIK